MERQLTDASPRSRADASRNRLRILDIAADVLAENPNASMQHIADAANLNRATLYRHFPTREELVEAIHDSLVQAAGDLYSSLPMEGPVLPALLTTFDAVVGLGERSRVLITAPIADPARRLEGERVAGLPVFAAIERGQDHGEITVAYDAVYLATFFWMQAMGAVLLISQGLATPESALSQARRALLEVLSAG